MGVRLECGYSWVPWDDLVALSGQVRGRLARKQGVPGARVGDWSQSSQWPLRHGHPSLPCGYPPPPSPTRPIIRILAHTPHPSFTRNTSIHLKVSIDLLTPLFNSRSTHSSTFEQFWCKNASQKEGGRDLFWPSPPFEVFLSIIIVFM